MSRYTWGKKGVRQPTYSAPLHSSLRAYQLLCFVDFVFMKPDRVARRFGSQFRHFIKVVLKKIGNFFYNQPSLSNSFKKGKIESVA